MGVADLSLKVCVPAAGIVVVADPYGCVAAVGDVERLFGFL
jgi:hypothetical protein